MTSNQYFVLVHGAYHGAWCWDLLGPELEQHGCSVIAVDLPCEDPQAGAEQYAATVAAAVPPGADAIIAVGHSMGGLTIPLLPARLRVARLVYLCAILPQPGVAFDDQHADLGSGFTPSEGPRANPDGSASWPELGAIELYYHDCSADVATWAARRLRPQHWMITQEISPLETWPQTPATYIVARQDRALAPDYCRRLARERLGVEPLEIYGGHSPFLARPGELAEMLVRVASRSIETS